MKVASLNTEPLTLAHARGLERIGEPAKAIAVYQKLLRNRSSALPALSRLMLIYRKLKKYDKEIEAIDKAISIHMKHYEAISPHNNKAGQLSRRLNLALGLTDKKGKTFYKPEEVLKLEKRRAGVMKKL